MRIGGILMLIVGIGFLFIAAAGRFGGNWAGGSFYFTAHSLDTKILYLVLGIVFLIGGAAALKPLIKRAKNKKQR